MIRQEQEQEKENGQILPNGEYKIIEVPDGRRTFVIVKKVGGSGVYQFFFKKFMGRHYPLGTILQSDGKGGVEIVGTAKEQGSKKSLIKNGPIKLSRLPSGIYIVIGEPNGNRTNAIIGRLDDGFVVCQVFFSSFRKRYIVPGNVLQVDGTGGIRVLK